MAKSSVLTILTSVSLLLLAITLGPPVSAYVESNAYVDSKNQFSINPPSGWTVDSSGAYGTAVILYGPTDSNFRINMNVVVQATSMSLNDYVSQSKTQLAATLTGYHLVYEGSVTIGGAVAYQLVNTFLEGTNNIFMPWINITDEQDILVQNQKAYVITSTALQSNYNRYQPSFDESAQTFQAIAPAAPAFPWLVATVGVVISIALVIGVTVFFWRRMSRAGLPNPMEHPMSQPPSSPPSESLEAPFSQQSELAAGKI